MSWQKELEELRAREALAEQMGGADKVARQHGRGKMDARARLAALCDEGSFREIGKIAGSARYDANGDLQSVTPAPFLFGKALINGRPVVATADDFTIRGGAADAGIARKMVQAEMMASFGQAMIMGLMLVLSVLILLFVLLYKIGDAMGQAMLSPMIVDLGFSDLDYISANKLWGFGALIVGSALGAPFILWLGMGRALLISGLLMMFSNFLFAVLAAVGHSPLIKPCSVEHL